MNEVASVILLYAVIVVALCALEFIPEFCKLSYLDRTSYMVNGTDCAYKGKNVHIRVVSKIVVNDPFASILATDTYYFNDAPIACLYKMEHIFHTSRMFIFNEEYDTSDFFKILKAGRNSHRKLVCEKLNKNSKKSFYKEESEEAKDESSRESENAGRN